MDGLGVPLFLETPIYLMLRGDRLLKSRHDAPIVTNMEIVQTSGIPPKDTLGVYPPNHIQFILFGYV